MDISSAATPRITPRERPDGRPALNIFNTLAHNRPLMKPFMSLGSHFLQEGELDARSREVVVLRVGWRSGAEYEFSQHRSIGRDAGLSDDEIERLCAVDSREWSLADLSLIDVADELCRDNSVSESTWHEAASHFTDPQMLELVMLVGFYRMVCGMLNGVGVALEPGAEGWPDGVTAKRYAPRS
jgi:4-carboxymuconolactone decarboxylase